MNGLPYWCLKLLLNDNQTNALVFIKSKSIRGNTFFSKQPSWYHFITLRARNRDFIMHERWFYNDTIVLLMQCETFCGNGLLRHRAILCKKTALPIKYRSMLDLSIYLQTSLLRVANKCGQWTSSPTSSASKTLRLRDTVIFRNRWIRCLLRE